MGVTKQTAGVPRRRHKAKAGLRLGAGLVAAGLCAFGVRRMYAQGFQQPVASIGDIAIAPSTPDVVYVGTGEANNRQSSTFGAGVFKSTDAGKTWKYAGLKETQSIARIVVHPKDPNTAYVAATGHLFGPN